MITSESVIKKIDRIKRLDDLVAINHYLDYLLYREQNTHTELGKSLIKGLEEILQGKTYTITSSKDILKVADGL